MPMVALASMVVKCARVPRACSSIALASGSVARSIGGPLVGIGTQGNWIGSQPQRAQNTKPVSNPVMERRIHSPLDLFTDKTPSVAIFPGRGYRFLFNAKGTDVFHQFLPQFRALEAVGDVGPEKVQLVANV